MVDLYNDVSAEQLRCFQELGFIRLGRLTTNMELAWLRTVCDEVVRAWTGHSPQELRRSNAGQNPLSLLTIPSPENIAPTLRSTIFYRTACKVFSRVLGVDEAHYLTGWRIFCKPSLSNITPWHQDAAYRPPPHRSVSIWLPLDPATQESGCLYYIPGSHQTGERPHYRLKEHLVVENIDPSQAVACPISPGEATMHHCYTLHCAGPNNVGQPRRAFTIVCQMKDNH